MFELCSQNKKKDIKISNFNSLLFAKFKNKIPRITFFMSFLPKPGEIIENDDLYEFSGDDDDRLRKEYE